MKKLISISASCLCLAIAAIAAPGLKTLSGYGNAASPATVIFPADPTTKLRLLNVFWGSDTNNAVLSISGGTAAYRITETNQATSSVTNKLNSTNALTGASVLVLQHRGVCYAAAVSTWNATTNAGWYGGTNVVLASGGWGVATSVGDSVYLLDTPVNIPIGVGTNQFSGTAIYSVASSGRPMRVQITPALATNKLYSVVAEYR